MFAVRGWNVPAAGLKTQKAAPDNENKSQRTEKENLSSIKTSRKRKRSKSTDETSKTDQESLRSHGGKRPSQEAFVGDVEKSSEKVAKSKPRRSHKDDAESRTPEHRLSSANAAPSDKLGKKDRTEQARVAKEGQKYRSLNSTSELNDWQSRSTTVTKPQESVTATESSKLTKLQSTMRQKLISSRFRHLNESLYTKTSAESREIFEQNPQFFTEYHEGFRRQVEAWPENPLDGFLATIRYRGEDWTRRDGQRHPKNGNVQDVAPGPTTSSQFHPLPRNARTGYCTIADLGCGEGRLAAALLDSPPRPTLAKRLKLNVYSYDLASTNPHVTACDIRQLPHQDDSVDVVIFCLALMGTNWIDFIEEANRVLRWKGECWISEVGSRFAAPKRGPHPVEHSVGRRKRHAAMGRPAQSNQIDDHLSVAVDEENSSRQHLTDVAAFVDVLRRRGFQLLEEPELGNRMFVRMRFSKSLPPSKGKGVLFKGQAAKPTFIETSDAQEISDEAEAAVLKPCVYKLR